MTFDKPIAKSQTKSGHFKTTGGSHLHDQYGNYKGPSRGCPPMVLGLSLLVLKIRLDQHPIESSSLTRTAESSSATAVVAAENSLRVLGSIGTNRALYCTHKGSLPKSLGGGGSLDVAPRVILIFHLS